MKVTLKDYQDDAVREVLDRFAKARRRWQEGGERNAFSLTAPTGAGKTVMAAAAFEALFHGDDTYDFDADPGALVIWFSDDPSLNEQSRHRLMASSDRLRHTDLVVVDNAFNRQRFEAGKVYFLNTQKLGKNSLLVRGFGGEGDEGAFPEIRPDTRAHTIWDTIRNTIEDPALRLYLVLDEAHRGMGSLSKAAANERSTLVTRLINGERGVPGIPIVLGISATVERFNSAMQGAKDRTTLPGVSVDVERVKESGLLKDTIALDVPDEDGKFDTVLLRRATEKLKEASEAWAAYTAAQEGESVIPLMVLQVPNTPKSEDIARWLGTIFETWSELPTDSVAHVFGDHTEQRYGGYTVPHISPERVQDDTWVRVLLAKDAISTGWDCPRAEVMVSFRPAKDRTYIAQLLGRMVRTPLARRIPGNDRLNSVDCLLPEFDEEAVKDIVKALMSGSVDTPAVGRVLVNPVDLKPNPDVSEAAWAKFTSIPSQTRPHKAAKPAIRLTALAHELASDDLLPRAGVQAHAAMHAFLDAFIEKSPYEFSEKRKAVLTVEGRTIIHKVRERETEASSFQTRADAGVVQDAYRLAARVLSPDIARSYTEHRARRKPEAGDDFEGALFEAREDIGALGLMENLGLHLDAEAKGLADEWFARFREEIKKLPDDRQEAYRELRALSREPQDVDLMRPVSGREMTTVIEANGSQTTLPLRKNHLLCNDEGQYPAELKSWEEVVLKAEMARTGFKWWYRNPDRARQDSLGIAYTVDGEVRILRPDFLFFAEEGDGSIVADLVDPHGTHLADAIPKLRGLADYAEGHPCVFRRIEAVAEVSGKMRALDLLEPEVRGAVRESTDAASLYGGLAGRDYS